MRIASGFLTGAALLAATSFAGQASAAGFASYFAILAGSGAVATSSGVSSAAKTATGVYEVTFGRPVNGCVLIGTLRGAVAGFIATIGTAGSPAVVTVTTYNNAGAKADLGFNLLVQCNS